MAQSPDQQRTSDRPHAVVVCANFPLPAYSGGRKRTLRLIEAMQRTGLHPHVLTLDGDATGHGEARQREWTVERLARGRDTARRRIEQHTHLNPTPASPALTQRLRGLAGTAKFVQLEEIEVAQYVTVTHADVPTVVSLHNVDSIARNPAAGTAAGLARLRAAYHRERLRAVERRSARLGRAVLAVSEADRSHFERLGARRAVLAPNGVDAELLAVATAPSEAGDVLFFGQATWSPNADGLRRFVQTGWPRVRAAHPHVKLRIAGPGTDRAFGDLTGAEGIEVLGLVDSIAEQLAAARAVIVPIWSGGGTRIKVLEAMASARPVIGTPAGVEELGFVDGRHGLVGATCEQLAEHLIAVLSDRGAADRLGAAAREHARGFAWELATAPAEALYRELMGARGAPKTHAGAVLR